MAPVVSGGVTDQHNIPHGQWRDGLFDCWCPPAYQWNDGNSKIELS